MYCKNCGKEVDSNAAVCVSCGTLVGQGNNFCGNCGADLVPGAAVCMSCGYAVQQSAIVSADAKSKMAAGLLGIFLGGYGVHNFYLGYTVKAIIQLSITILGILTSCIYIGFLLIPAASIWGLVEGILILTGSIKVDGKGNPLRE